MVDASELIPEEGIFLLEAFEYVFQAMTPNWRELEDRLVPLAVSTGSSQLVEEKNESIRLAWTEYDRAQLQANEWLRSCIGKGLIRAFVSFNGALMKLPHHGWESSGFLQSGIDSNFVSPEDPMNPGPDTEIEGARRPVCFRASEFEALVQKSFGASLSIKNITGPSSLERTKNRPGRQKGQGSFEPLDLPILDEMKALILSRKAASPEEAARMLADQAHGGGSVESKSERLAKRYRKRPD